MHTSRFPPLMFAFGAILLACRSDTERTPSVARPIAFPAAPADVRAAPPDAARSSSGLASRVLAAGSGPPAKGQDQFILAYDAWTFDGTPFASTYARRETVAIDRDLMFPGLRELVDEMREGEKRRAWIPAPLTEGGKPPHPEGGVVMDLELIQVRVHHGTAPIATDASR